MEIRYLTPNDDLNEISRIYEESWKYAYRGIVPQSYLDSIPHGKWAKTVQKFNTLVMNKNDTAVGTSSFCPSRWEKFSGYGEIVSIYLLPEYIGKGYGNELLEKVIAELHRQGFENILLWVLEENHRARRFYEKHGFVLTDEQIGDDIGGKKLKEIMYILK